MWPKVHTINYCGPPFPKYSFILPSLFQVFPIFMRKPKQFQTNCVSFYFLPNWTLVATFKQSGTTPHFTHTHIKCYTRRAVLVINRDNYLGMECWLRTSNQQSGELVGAYTNLIIWTIYPWRGGCDFYYSQFFWGVIGSIKNICRSDKLRILYKYETRLKGVFCSERNLVYPCLKVKLTILRIKKQ